MKKNFLSIIILGTLVLNISSGIVVHASDSKNISKVGSFTQNVEMESKAYKIIYPYSDYEYNGDIRVVIDQPTTQYAIESVEAQIANKIIKLEHSYDVHCDDGYNIEGWSGEFNSNELPQGTNKLQVTVTDMKGNKYIKTQDVKVKCSDRIKKLSLMENQFVNLKEYVEVEAEGINYEDCEICLCVTDSSGINILAKGVNKINTTIDFSKYVGEEIQLTVQLTNKGGAMTQKVIPIFVCSKNMNKINSISGKILDFNDDRVLYSNYDGEAVLKNVKTGEEMLICTTKAYNYKYMEGWITDKGAVVQVDDDISYKIGYIYTNGKIEYLGRIEGLTVSGNYTAFEKSGKLFLENTNSEEIKIVCDDFDSKGFSVDDKGKVTFASQRDTFTTEVYRYYEGKIERISNKGSVEGRVDPISDRDLTVYTRGCDKKGHIEGVVNKNGEESILFTIDGVDSNNYSYCSYIVKNGCVAYSYQRNGIYQVGIWKDGVNEQLTFSTDGAKLIDLNENGDIIIFSGGKYSIIKINGDVVDLLKATNYPKIINVLYKGNELYTVIGGSLIKIDYSDKNQDEDINLEVSRDLNKDGVIDYLDLTIVGQNYNYSRGDDRWNNDYDVNNDGTIDLSDLILVGNKIK